MSLTAQSDDPAAVGLNTPGGLLSGVECTVCHNKGYILWVDAQGCLWGKDCYCMEKRRELRKQRLRQEKEEE